MMYLIYLVLFLDLQLFQTMYSMLSLLCLFTVIGGENVYLSLSVSGECDDKDSVWKTLLKEVLYRLCITMFNMDGY